MDEVLYRRVMAINLNAVYWMCQHMIRKRFKKGGVIINIGAIEAAPAPRTIYLRLDLR